MKTKEMNLTKNKLTFEQHMQLREINRRHRIAFMIKLRDCIRNLGSWFWMFVKVFATMFISACAGIGSEPIIYALNKPFGTGYAHVASYIVAAGVMVLLNQDMIRSKK